MFRVSWHLSNLKKIQSTDFFLIRKPEFSKKNWNKAILKIDSLAKLRIAHNIIPTKLNLY